MRSIPAFLLAFIVTVVISGALMIGCGGGGGGGTAPTGGATNTGATNTGATNTGATNTGSNNNNCKQKGEECAGSSECCGPNSCVGGGVMLNPFTLDPLNPIYVNDYVCDLPAACVPGGGWCGASIPFGKGDCCSGFACTSSKSNNNSQTVWKCTSSPNTRYCVEEPSYGKYCNTNGGPECCAPNQSCFRLFGGTEGTCR
jgi:hypothetical protein